MSPEPIDVLSLSLPGELVSLIGGALLFDSSGCSGCRTLFAARGAGLYVKIAPEGRLKDAARMQRYFHAKGFSVPVLLELSEGGRDFLAVAALPGRDGTAEEHLAEPARLAALFGEALRALHETDCSDCPAPDRTTYFLSSIRDGGFLQSHLDLLSPYIGPARVRDVFFELQKGKPLLKSDALLHGDACLPNLLIDGWRFSGFVDVADGGAGDRHYDLAWGLWTLCYNLKTAAYGARFLDAYGRDRIDPARLRLCGLLAAAE